MNKKIYAFILLILSTFCTSVVQANKAYQVLLENKGSYPLTDVSVIVESKSHSESMAYCCIPLEGILKSRSKRIEFHREDCSLPDNSLPTIEPDNVVLLGNLCRKDRKQVNSLNFSITFSIKSQTTSPESYKVVVTAKNRSKRHNSNMKNNITMDKWKVRISALPSNCYYIGRYSVELSIENGDIKVTVVPVSKNRDEVTDIFEDETDPTEDTKLYEVVEVDGVKKPESSSENTNSSISF